MSRLLFPDDFDAESASGTTPGPAFWSVSELTALVRASLEYHFADVAIRGEVSNLARPRSGHVYLSLKDDASQVRAVIWRAAAERIPFELEDGLAVRVWGRLTVYAPRGEYQLTVSRIEPEGIGALDLAFRQLCERLRAEGLFDAARKRPLPRFPRRVVVVTSPTGAAVRDFLQVTGRRWPSAEILVAPTLVQGPGAAEQVAAALALADTVAGADLIVLARGGGSVEDLGAFNQEVVARAIAASRTPVVSAVGHEIDVTLADLVADHRAATPTEAGERCVPDAREVAQHLDRLGDRLARAGEWHLEDARARLDDLADRASRALTRTLDERRHSLSRLAARLEALSPLAVLSRGYSLTLHPDGRPVRDSAEVRPGDLLTTRLATGQVVSRVVEAG